MLLLASLGSGSVLASFGRPHFLLLRRVYLGWPCQSVLGLSVSCTGYVEVTGKLLPFLVHWRGV